MEDNDKKFLEMIVKELVDHPEDVKVARTVDERGVLLTLAINPEDMGKVIGREGKTAESLRTLLRIIGARSNARVNLKILEPEGSENVRPPRRNERNESEEISEKPITEVADEVEEEVAVTQPVEEKATEII